MLTTKDLKDLFGENSPDKVILRAQRLAARGRNDQAVAVIKEAIGRLGEVADLRQEMATLHLSAGRPREAADSLRALLKADSSQVRRVEEFLGWARTQFSDIEPLYEPMAEGHIGRRNYNAAVECLERINKKTLEAALEGRLANLNRFIEKGAHIPKSALPTLYFAALAYEAIGDWSRAVDSYRRILVAAPADFAAVDERLKALVARHYKLIPLRLTYAEILEGSGQRDRAKDEFLKALEMDRRCAPQVERYIQALLQASPESPDLLWSSVRVSLAKGEQEEAFRICGRLCDANSHLPEIEKLLEELAAAGKESVETQLLLGKVSLAQGKVSRAVAAIVSALADDAGQRGIEALEKVREAFPGEARPYQILADYHLKEGRVERCLEIYRALRRVDPASAPAISTRLQALLSADPSNTAARDLLEEICIEAGEVQGAVPFLRRRLRRGAGAAREALDRLKGMLLSAPGDESLKFAAGEACMAGGEAAAAWSYLQDTIQTGGPADGSLLHLIVLCAGSSPEMFRKVASHLSSSAPRWCEQPEVIFALAESAGRSGHIREAVERYLRAAAVSPEAASVCHAAIRGLGECSKTPLLGEDAAILAEALLDAGDLAGATEALRSAGALPPVPAARLVDRFTEALRSDPGNLALSAGLAQACLASGQIARALEIARAGIAGREDAASAPLAMLCGEALMKSGNLGEATRAYAAAARRDQAQVHEVIKRLQQVIQIDLGLDSAHLVLGRLLINEGHVREGANELLTAWSIKADLRPVVLKDLERTARKHPAEISLDFAMSQLLLAAGDAAAASQALGRQIGLDPELTAEIIARLEGIATRHPACARAQVELGRGYLSRRWAARACACLARAFEVDRALSESILILLAEVQRDFPDEPAAYTTRGSFYEAAGKPAPAAECYFKAACLGGAGGAAALQALRRLCAAGGGVPARAQLLRSRACRMVGEVSEAVDAARCALEAGGDLTSEIRAELDQLVVKYPFNAVARLGRAAACIRTLDVGSAARDLSEALRFDPASSDSVVALAREILRLQPSSLPATRALADALLAAGDSGGAARALDEALASPEGRSDIDLILARRSMALEDGDIRGARDLLARAESASVSRDELLERLHRGALKKSSGAVVRQEPAGLAEAIARADYFQAAEISARGPASPLRAWVLERCGRFAEAAACLEGILQEKGAAARYARLHDHLVARHLEGRAEVLVGETLLGFEGLDLADEIAPRVERAGGAAEGGVR